MEHQEWLSGLITLHVLHHAAEGGLYGEARERPGLLVKSLPMAKPDLVDDTRQGTHDPAGAFVMRPVSILGLGKRHRAHRHDAFRETIGEGRCEFRPAGLFP